MSKSVRISYFYDFQLFENNLLTKKKIINFLLQLQFGSYALRFWVLYIFFFFFFGRRPKFAAIFIFMLKKL